MGFINDLFGGSAETYPLAPKGPQSRPCGDGSWAQPERDSWLTKLFCPKQLPYPLRSCDVPPTVPTVPAQPTGPTQPIGPPITRVVTDVVANSPASNAASGANGAAGSSAPAAPTVAAAPIATVPTAPASSAAGGPSSPVTVVISLPDRIAAALAPSAPVGSAAPSIVSSPSAPVVTGGGASAPATPSAGEAPAPVSPAAPVPPVVQSPAPVPPVAAPVLAPVGGPSRLLRAWVHNPSFVPCYPTAHEALIEQMVDEVIAARMVISDATPVVFVVPEGCDAVDLLYGPIEVTPGCGCDADLDQIVTVGEAKLSANVCNVDGPLTPGDQLMVTVPWRAASWVDLEAGRLRMQVLAHFYRREQPASACTLPVSPK